MEKTRKNTIIIVLVAALLLVIASVLVGIGVGDIAYADGPNKDFMVEQTLKIEYCGENYLSGNTLKNTFLNAFTFLLDDEIFAANTTNTTIYSSGEIYEPGTYFCTFTIQTEDGQYSAESVRVVVSKRTVMVKTLLNGVTDLTVSEGDPVSVLYSYEGAVAKDTTIVSLNGIKVTVLNDDVLSNKAFVSYLPSEPVEKYTVVAEHARSDYYDFQYAKSVLTVKDSIVPNLFFQTNKTLLVSLTGRFSSISELEYRNVGTSSTSEEYVAITEQAKQAFLGQTVLDDNDILGCYSISVTKLGELPTGNVEAVVQLILPDSAAKRSSYKVLALYNNGDAEILNASIAGNVLTFNAADMGVFLVLSPTQGLSVTTYVIAIVIGVVVVLLVIFLVSLFRRKY